jgi:hypothetical protein
MDQKKFEAMLVLIVPQVIALIVKHMQTDELSAARAFYGSQLYALLEQEETKLWHFSPLLLFHMYEEECLTGAITFPEG